MAKSMSFSTGLAVFAIIIAIIGSIIGMASPAPSAIDESNECTSPNPRIGCQLFDRGIANLTIAAGANSAVSATVSFHSTAPRIPRIDFPIGNASLLVNQYTNLHFDFFAGKQTWTMPLASTELFGEVSHEVLLNLGAQIGGVSCTFTVNILVPDIAGSFLRVQYTSDLVNWFELATPTTSGDVSVSTAGFQFTSFTTKTAAIIDSFGNPQLAFRVVGFGGNGLTVATLGSIGLDCSSDPVPTYYTIVDQITTTNFMLSVYLANVVSVSTKITIAWQAWLP